MEKNYTENSQKNLFPYNPDSSRFVVLCRREDYSATRIAHAIEDVGAHVLNLNVTDQKPAGDDLLAVDVRVDRQDISSIIRSVARYDFTVFGEANASTAITEAEQQRIAELLRYIDV